MDAFIPCLYDEWEEYMVEHDEVWVRCQVKECFTVSALDRTERIVLTSDSRALHIDDYADSPLRVLHRDTLFRALYGDGFTHG